jgi:hypothetical protein
MPVCIGRRSGRFGSLLGIENCQKFRQQLVRLIEAIGPNVIGQLTNGRQHPLMRLTRPWRGRRPDRDEGTPLVHFHFHGLASRNAQLRLNGPAPTS